MKEKIISLCAILSCASMAAHDIEVDGIFYNYDQNSQTVSVANKTGYSGCYSGNVVIPSEISYKGKKMPVTSIGKNAFENCVDLLSVKLPNSLITIEQQAFKNCRKLSQIDFPKSLTTIESEAFLNCRDIEKIIIPANVKKVGNDAFSLGRNNLFSTLYIEDGNEEIDFYDSDGSTLSYFGVRNIYIGRPRKSDGGYSTASGGTYNPKILGIGKNVVSEHFENVTSLKEIYSKIVEPNTHHVYFSNTTYLNSKLYVPIGTKEKYMVSEGWNNFFEIEEMDASLMWESNKEMEGIDHPSGDGTKESPYNVIGLYRYFEDNLEWNQNTEEMYVTGYVTYGGFGNDGCSMGIADLNNEAHYLYYSGNYFNNRPFTDNDSNVEVGDKVVVFGKYKQDSGTMRSVPNTAYLISVNGSESGTTTKKKCEVPIISYEAGKLKFTCATEGATFVSEITDTDIDKYTESIINLSVTYNIRVYATANGYENSDLAKATLCWIDMTPESYGVNNGIAEIRSMPLLIQNQEGTIYIAGIGDSGTTIRVFNTAGQLMGAAKTNNGEVSIDTHLSCGNVVIVQVGNNSVKYLLR